MSALLPSCMSASADVDLSPCLRGERKDFKTSFNVCLSELQQFSLLVLSVKQLQSGVILQRTCFLSLTLISPHFPKAPDQSYNNLQHY